MTSNNGVKEMVTPVTEYNPFELRTNTISADWWPDKLTVTVKERSFGETQDMQRDQIGGKMKMPKDKAHAARLTSEMEMDISLVQVSTMVHSILSWTFVANGKPAPINAESIRRLSNKDGQFIMDAIEELNPNSDDDDFPSDS